MKFENLEDIQQALVSDVVGIYKYDITKRNEINDFDKFFKVHEVLSFIFEDYRQEFDRVKIVEQLKLDKDELNHERILFTSWCTLEVINKLNKILN